MDISFEQKVRERAYEIWMAAGMADGMAHDNWVKAEQAVANESGEPVKAPKKKAAATLKVAATKTKAAPKAKSASKAKAAKAAPKAKIAARATAPKVNAETSRATH